MNNKLIPQAVIFDWDNTLVDTWPLIQRAIDDTMVKMGREPWGLEKVKNNVHNSMRESFPAIFGNQWQDAGEIYRQHYHSNNLTSLAFLPGAIELLNKLEQMKIMQLIISNKIGNTLRKEVDFLGIKDKFFAVIGSQDALADKPSKEPVDLALEGSDLDPKNDLIWFIGDSIVDLECAHNSSCQPVLYGSGENIAKNFLDHSKKLKDKPLLHFHNHQDILAYLTR
jgi:phosphoglycolate phosphatase